jgi:hypothetical protein
MPYPGGKASYLCFSKQQEKPSTNATSGAQKVENNQQKFW